MQTMAVIYETYWSTIPGGQHEILVSHDDRMVMGVVLTIRMTLNMRKMNMHAADLGRLAPMIG